MSSKLKTSIVVLVMIMGCLLRSNAQTTPLLELYKLHSAYGDSAGIAFDLAIYMEDISADTIKRDTLHGTFECVYGKFRMTMGNVETINDGQYSITVYHDQKIMMLQNMTSSNTAVMQGNMLDSAFFAVYTDSLSLRDSGSYRILKYHFKENMPYLNYEIVYNSTTYNISFISYSLRKEMEVSDTGYSTDNLKINVKADYHSYYLPDFPFTASTSLFFTRINGVFVPKAPYTDYQLVNSINQ